MNISASLSIKTATIGGAASGSFIDSDKFKESDMNFFVQVKVVNQIIFGEDHTEFQNILPAGARFTEVYGVSLPALFDSCNFNRTRIHSFLDLKRVENSML